MAGRTAMAQAQGGTIRKAGTCAGGDGRTEPCHRGQGNLGTRGQADSRLYPSLVSGRDPSNATGFAVREGQLPCKRGFG